MILSKKAGFIMILLAACCGLIRGEDIYFPFFSRLYSYTPGSRELRQEQKSPGLFSKDFYPTSWGVLVSEGSPELKRLVLTNPGSPGRELLSGKFAQIYVLAGYVLTVSSEFTTGKGFTWGLYKLEERQGSPEVRPLSSYNSGLFISDFLVLGDTLLLSGSDQENKNNYLYFFDCTRPGPRLLYKQKKQQDFLKLVRIPGRIGCYSSTLPGEKEQGTFLLFNERELTRGSGEITPLTLTVQFPGKWAFFGKGFGYNASFYLPVITEDHSILLYQLNAAGDLIRSNPLPTGIYTVLAEKEGIMYLVGYNYLQDPGAFYFLAYDPLGSKVITMLPLESK